MTASFGAAWSAGEPSAERWLRPDHRDPSTWPRRVREAARSLDASVRAGLEASNQGRDDPSVRDQLDRLAGPVAFVVAGQQVGLFGGPLYTVLKALAAVRWARRLSEASAQVVVPLFWLQTEDHDREEVAAWTGPTPDGGLHRAELPDDGRARVPMGDRALPGEIEREVERLVGALGSGLDGPAVAHWLRRAYRPGRTWSQAFADLLGELLRGRGLLFWNPREPACVACAAPLHARAFAEHDALASALQRRSEALVAAGWRPQVAVRAESLSFVQPAGAGGARHRAAPVDGGWRLSGGGRRVDRATLERWLKSEPARFSTSALLRPVVQDALLPVVALVAGPGEVSYLVQCIALYEQLGVRPAFVVPRPRARLVEPWARRLGDRWDIRPEAVGPTVDETLAHMRPPQGPGPQEIVEGLRAARQRFVEETEDLGADVEPARRVFEARLERASRQFAQKYERIRQRRDGDRWAAARRLTDQFFPRGIPQERVFGIIPFLVRYGSGYVVERLAAALEADAVAVRNVDL